MKKLKFLSMLIACLTAMVAFTSCGDDNDEPDVLDTTTGTETYYGIIKPTGVHTISLFASAHDGETVLSLPGFAPIRLRTYYNIYKHHNDGAGLYAEDMGNDFAEWRPGIGIPASFSEVSWDSQILVRTKVKGSDSYVYAYIERVSHLTESTGAMGANVIGGIYRYTSPIDPATFTGFPEK